MAAAPKEVSRAQADMLVAPNDLTPRIRTLLLGERSTIEKDIGGGATSGSNQLDVDNKDAAAFLQRGAIVPPYNPETLCLLFEHSAGLRPNIDAYATNIEGFGYRLEPHFNLDSDEGRRRLAAAVGLKKKKLKKSTHVVAKPPEPGSDNNAVNGAPELSQDQIQEALGELADEMLIERIRLDRFFEQCCDQRSFVKTRRLTRQDLEIMGNAYWEVLRNRAGDVAQFEYLPGYTVRLLPMGRAIPVKVNLRVDDLNFETVERFRKFRIFVQIVDSEIIYFKEFGDPRLISSKTGNVFKTPEEMKEEEPEAVAATEILHFKIDSPMSSYGVPRWIGTLLAVMGSRQSEEVNFLYFENKSVPPLAILVSGGKLSDGSIERLQDHIETNIKGKNNFHKILVLEAESAQGGQLTDTSTRMKIQIVPLISAQQSDALFQKYDERNMDKIGGSFRMPRLLRGDIRDFNRSTAMAALNFAETQVFQPEREDFDWIINHVILRSMGVRFWKFVSRSPVTRDPVAMAEIIRNLMNANVLVPEEARDLTEDVFNREFRKLDAQWVKQPMQMTLAGIPAFRAESPGGVIEEKLSESGETSGDTGTPPKPSEKLRKGAVKMLRLREQLEKAEEDAWRAMMRERNL